MKQLKVKINVSVIYKKTHRADLCEKCSTHSSQHDANYQPPEGPDADERRGAAAGHLGESPQRTQEDGEKTRLQQLTLPTLTQHKASTDIKVFLWAEPQRAKKRIDDSHFSEAIWVQTTVCLGFTENQTPNSKSIIRLPARWPHLSVMSCSQFNRDHFPFK